MATAAAAAAAAAFQRGGARHRSRLPTNRDSWTETVNFARGLEPQDMPLPIGVRPASISRPPSRRRWSRIAWGNRSLSGRWGWRSHPTGVNHLDGMDDDGSNHTLSALDKPLTQPRHPPHSIPETDGRRSVSREGTADVVADDSGRNHKGSSGLCRHAFQRNTTDSELNLRLPTAVGGTEMWIPGRTCRLCFSKMLRVMMPASCLLTLSDVQLSGRATVYWSPVSRSDKWAARGTCNWCWTGRISVSHASEGLRVKRILTTELGKTGVAVKRETRSPNTKRA